jgi:hypothetical protein
MLPLLFPGRLLVDVGQMKLLGQLFALAVMLGSRLTEPESFMNRRLDIQASITSLW